VFPKISTSLKLPQVLSMLGSIGDYEIAQSTGFPFALKGAKLGKKGDVLVPCTLSSNVSALHKLMYGQEDYDATEAVDAISDYIINETGYNEGSATVTQSPEGQ
nr:LytR family transcriptional regulator [Pseudobutyrivibrio sp.]